MSLQPAPQFIYRGVATKNSLVRPRKQLIDAQRRMCMCFFEIIITIIVDIGHLNSLNQSFSYLIVVDIGL